MNDLLKTRFFILLADSSKEVINTEMKDAYEEFIKQIVTISYSEDYSHIFRTLNLTRIEIAPLKSYINASRGKNALKNLYIHKALSLIDSELQLINLKINHPEQFVSSVTTEFKSDLYVIPKSKDLGIIGIAEIVIALFLQGQIVGEDGKPVPEVRLARGFEQLFNLKFGSIYDKVNEVFNRKQYNLTKTLDALRNTIIKEDKNVRTVKIRKDDFSIC